MSEHSELAGNDLQCSRCELHGPIDDGSAWGRRLCADCRVELQSQVRCPLRLKKGTEWKVLVCGSRTIAHRYAAFVIEKAMRSSAEPDHDYDCYVNGCSVSRTVLIHGGAEGADTLAAQAAKKLGWTIRSFPADWANHGRKAGPMRNQMMLSDSPDVVFAFIDKPLKLSRGTSDMVSRAQGAGIPCFVYDVREKP